MQPLTGDDLSAFLAGFAAKDYVRGDSIVAAKTLSFVTEIPLVTTFKDLAILAARLEAGRQLYNAVLAEGRTRIQLVRNSELYQRARLLDKNEKKARSLAFQKARVAYRFSDYDLQSFANTVSIASAWIKSHLDAQTIQKIATSTQRRK